MPHSALFVFIAKVDWFTSNYLNTDYSVDGTQTEEKLLGA
ncbi:Uncharacterized protein YR821_1995 [Yersinia ruckeri]|uniref:Uncharacterized protein n=1 Tax=Yersinia ruckeri TaxID=29486 RepID=A0A0A8VJP5_YERRU|nr:hypothetical protein yruck0001_11930 [Yersinia ruckeri ATCC 29473]QTD76916.1 Uncharacterized protein YR821_1995 [Yersinia ruckeri]CEK27811.1 hypothetical protein CSF007_10305 [Yersinia ruckeri]